MKRLLMARADHGRRPQMTPVELLVHLHSIKPSATCELAASTLAHPSRACTCRGWSHPCFPRFRALCVFIAATAEPTAARESC